MRLQRTEKVSGRTGYKIHIIYYSGKDAFLPNGIADLFKIRYDRNAFKLLTALNGKRVTEYQEFALKEKPFFEGARGISK